MADLHFLHPTLYEPEILIGLEGVLERSDAGWVPEEVLRELRASRAMCFGSQDGSEFVVLRTKDTYHGMALFIWVAWSQDGSAIGRHWEQIKEIGRESGCRFVEFWSAREAFERRSPMLGVEPWMTIYRGDL